MPNRTFWCLEGLHYFDEDDSAGRREYNKAICKSCTKRIMEEFFKSSDELKMSSIWENIVDGREVKRRWFRRKYAKEKART